MSDFIGGMKGHQQINSFVTAAQWILNLTLVDVTYVKYFVRTKSISTSSSVVMMTSSNGTIFYVTGLLCGEFIGHRWIPLTKASDTELWCILWSVPEQAVK